RATALHLGAIAEHRAGVGVERNRVVVDVTAFDPGNVDLRLAEEALLQLDAPRTDVVVGGNVTRVIRIDRTAHLVVEGAAERRCGLLVQVTHERAYAQGLHFAAEEVRLPAIGGFEVDTFYLGCREVQLRVEDFSDRTRG